MTGSSYGSWSPVATSTSLTIRLCCRRRRRRPRFILNYLRDSYIGLDSFGKEDLHFLEELSHEAQFFNIAGLCADISRRYEYV